MQYYRNTYLCYLCFLYAIPVMYPADTLTAYYMFLVNFDIAPWVHYIWIPIGLWQALWITYVMVNLYRRDARTGYAMYYAPGSIPISTYSMFSCALISTVSSQAALSNGYLNMSFTFDLLTSLTLFFAIYFSSRRLHNDAAILIQTGRPGHVMLIRGLVHNGIGLFAGWTDFMVFIKLGKLIVFYGGVDGDTAGSVCLTMYTLYLSARLVLDIVFWDDILRHLLTPYLTSVVAMVGMLTQNYDAKNTKPVHYVIASVLAVISLLFLIRLAEIIIRNKKDTKQAKSAHPVQPRS